MPNGTDARAVHRQPFAKVNESLKFTANLRNELRPRLPAVGPGNGHTIGLPRGAPAPM